MRAAAIAIFLCAGAGKALAKDNIKITFALAQAQNVERIKDVDMDQFKGERLGFGFLFESERLKNIYAFELGLYKLHRQYSIAPDSSAIVEEIDRLHAPLLARYYPLDFLSLGLGVYGAYSVSKKERSLQENNSSATITSAAKAEYGIAGSLSLKLAQLSSVGLPNTDLILDLRWLEPFQQKSGEETNNFHALFGVQVEI